MTSKRQFDGERVKLGEVCSKGKSSLRQKDVANDGPYAVYGAAGIIGTMDTYQNEEPYIAVVKDGAGVGRVCLCEAKTSVLGTMQALIPGDGVDRNYLLHLVRSLDLGKGFTGSTIPHIYFKDYSKREVQVPALEMQREIVTRLGAIETSIDEAHQLIRELDTLVKSRFVEMFGEQIEVSNNDSWPRLGDLSDVTSGITKGRKPKTGVLAEVPYMAVSNVKAGYIDLTRVKTIKATTEEIDRYRLEPGDVLMTEGGDPDKLGRGAVIRSVPHDCIHQNHVFRVRLDEDILFPEYLEIFLLQDVAKLYFLSCAKKRGFGSFCGQGLAPGKGDWEVRAPEHDQRH